MNEAIATHLVFLSSHPGSSFEECSLEMEIGSGPWQGRSASRALGSSTRPSTLGG